MLKVAMGCWLLLVGSSRATAQPTLHKDLKKDFGALGDGHTNDQPAFARAAEFFNERAKKPAGTGRAVLHLPAGTYLVGQPGPATVPDLLPLRGCRNLRIEGADSATTEIRYADGLYYGTFDPATHLPYEGPTAFFTATGWALHGGTAIVLEGCDNVEISRLRLNGNSGRLVVGGHWGDTGIQLPFDGIFVSNSRRIRLRKLAVHHFGRDGIQVLNHLAKSVDDPAQEAILLENSRFDYNGRQGLSITGVNGLRAVNCSFSHTGRVIIAALNRPLYSNPGAGIDIEPEGGYAANVRLERCRLVDNAGQALVSDRYGSGPPTTRTIVLRDCLLWGVSNWSAWVRQTDFLFENCRLYGAFVAGCGLADHATRFVGCTFEDRPYRGQPAYGQHLVYSSQEARAMSFANCRFVGTRNGLLYAVAAAADSASAFRLHGCTFVLDQAEPPLGVDNLLTTPLFSGTNTVASGPQRTTPAPTNFILGTTETTGSVLLRPGGQLRLLAPGCRYLLQNGLAIGQSAARKATSVVVGLDNIVSLNEAPGKEPELYIAPGAQLLIKKGGALEIQPHTKVTIAGKLVIEDGAYFFQDPRAKVTTTGQGQLRVAPGARLGKHPQLQEAYSQATTD